MHEEGDFVCPECNEFVSPEVADGDGSWLLCPSCDRWSAEEDFYWAAGGDAY